MIKFLLNNTLIETKATPGIALLDFIRKQQQLKGTKLVCKEGECGACTILVGNLSEGEIQYQSMTSCIMPLINANGKHIVTIEGLNMTKLSPVQQAMIDAYGSQCGFCTPGFVVSLTGHLLSNKKVSEESIIESIDGNICRCTGYKSIERAAQIILEKVETDLKNISIATLIQSNYIPAYFKFIKNDLADIQPKFSKIKKGIKLGGGSDLYVQQPYKMYETTAISVFDQPSLNQIEIKNGICTFGAALTMGALYRSKIFKKALPDSNYFFKLLSSTQIRNMATIGGNLVNASPIGDFTIMLLGLDANLILNKKGNQRSIALKEFYKDYKKIALNTREYVEQIQFKIPKSDEYHFEKVSQRKYLDIATVNFASHIQMDKKRKIKVIHLAVGGVGPIPMYLHKTVAFMKGKVLDNELLKAAIEILYAEISPISDTRGSAAYKKLLARQLFIAQFLKKNNTLSIPKALAS